jgi:hypothetical protein
MLSGAAFTLWIILFVVQISLVRARRTVKRVWTINNRAGPCHLCPSEESGRQKKGVHGIR